jgi:predicted PurR-regulated permease PerM
MPKEFSAKMNKSEVDICESEDAKQSKKSKSFSIGEYVNNTKNTIKIEIPPKTMITVLLVALAIFLVFRLMNVFIILFFAMVLASATLPSISAMVRKGFPRWLSISIIYIFSIALLVTLTALIAFPLVTQTANFAEKMATVSESSLESLDDFNIEALGISGSNIKEHLVIYIQNVSEEIFPSISGTATAITKAVDTLVGFGGFIVMVISILILSIYIVADHDRVVDLFLVRVNDKCKRDRIRELIVDVEYKLGRWLVGQGTVSLIVGFFTWLILTLFNVPFALPLAGLAALLEVVPNLGPVMVSIPITLIALFAHGPLVAVLVLVSYIIVQQLQNYFLTPRVMGKVVGLEPLVVFLGFLVGFTLAGIIGAVLAVPLLVLGKIGFKFYRDLQKLKAKGMV